MKYYVIQDTVTGAILGILSVAGDWSYDVRNRLAEVLEKTYGEKPISISLVTHPDEKNRTYKITDCRDSYKIDLINSTLY